MSIVTSSCGCSPDRNVGAGTTGVSLYARTWLLADALANVAPGTTRAQRGVFVDLMMIQIAAADGSTAVACDGHADAAAGSGGAPSIGVPQTALTIWDIAIRTHHAISSIFCLRLRHFRTSGQH
ncbi:hypothetical protein [Burkholderia territorii]|uniref:hypothetical protein n=1 Tax=Burkholderia territorii TaxID=1503055 RepID=UPI001EEFC1FE|nr:hypothetical protein [Burkholderia territorii]